MRREKNKVSVIGDFNNWTETLASQMNRTLMETVSGSVLQD